MSSSFFCPYCSLAYAQEYCRVCGQATRPWDQLRISLSRCGWVSDAVNAVQYNRDVDALRRLAEAAVYEGGCVDVAEDTVFIGVARHWRAVQYIGYNPAELCAGYFARKYTRAYVAQLCHYVRKSGGKYSLSAKTYFQRKRFFGKIERTAESNFIVVEAIMGEGSALRETCCALRHAGAIKVNAWAVVS